MHETEYTYAVARIRANEPLLLTENDINQLINADNYETAKRMLTDKGWNDSDENSFDICENELNAALNLIKESTGDNVLVEALSVGNDFLNLKAAIKAFFSDIESSDFMTFPCLCSPDTIIKAVKEKDFSILPSYLSGCGKEAFSAVSSGNGGQAAEIIIDKARFDTIAAFADKTDSGLLKKITSVFCAVANIKVAKRSKFTGKTKDFALSAVTAGCKSLDIQKLIDAAFAGESLAPVISDAGLPEIAGYADGDFNSLEMFCDNYITEMTKKQKYEIFGADPVVAYYYAKLAEVRNVRIILSAKASGVPNDIIRQRVRDLYV